MSDSMDNLLLSERVAPYSIKYSQLTPLAFKARSSPVKFFTSNQSNYTPQNNILRIPISSATSCLDGTNSFLKLTYTNQDLAGNDHKFSNSAHSLIKRLRIVSQQGGMDLEDIREYWQIHASMSDLLLAPDNRSVRVEQGYGYNSTPVPAAFVGAVGGNPTAAEFLAESGKVRNALTAGALVGGNGSICTNELTVARNASVTLAFPLELSALLGTAQKKFLPLFLFGDIILEIELNPVCVSNVTDVAPVWSISNVEYHAQLVEFDSAVNIALTNMARQSGLFIHGCSWTTVYSQLANGQNTVVCSERLRSLKSVFVGFTDPALDYTQRKTSRNNHTITNYRLKAGGMYIPNFDVTGIATDATKNAEFVVETYKAIGEYSNSIHSGLMNSYSFASNVASDVKIGRSLYGIDCDAFGRSDTESGLSTIENNPMTFQFTQATAGAMNCYFMMLHDCIWSVDVNGSVSISK